MRRVNGGRHLECLLMPGIQPSLREAKNWPCRFHAKPVYTKGTCLGILSPWGEQGYPFIVHQNEGPPKHVGPFYAMTQSLKLLCALIGLYVRGFSTLGPFLFSWGESLFYEVQLNQSQRALWQFQWSLKNLNPATRLFCCPHQRDILLQRAYEWGVFNRQLQLPRLSA